MIARRTFCIGAVAVGVGACSRGDKEDDKGPPSISYGTEICDRCRMVIDDERHAAALRSGDEWLLFDDCGEMITSAKEQQDGELVAWVHDFDTKEWVEAQKAYYVWLPDLNTPMGTGIIAFSEQGRAEARATESGGWFKGWDAMLAEWSIE